MNWVTREDVRIGPRLRPAAAVLGAMLPVMDAFYAYCSAALRAPG